MGTPPAAAPTTARRAAMNASARSVAEPTRDPPTPRPEVRAKVMDLFGNTKSFHQLPQAKQKQVLHDTALIADALVGKGEPGTASVVSRAMADGANQWQQDKAAV